MADTMEHAIQAARDVSQDLDISAEAAAAAVAAGALEAAAAEGQEALLAVRASLPDDIAQDAVDAVRNLLVDPGPETPTA